jgi:hypothetical protein
MSALLMPAIVIVFEKLLFSSAEAPQLVVKGQAVAFR